MPQDRRKLQDRLETLLGDESATPLSPRIRLLLTDMREEWLALDRRIGAFDDEFVEMARTDTAARRLATIPGIGAMNATALLAAVGQARASGRGRDLAAWLGLVLRQATTGGRPRLLGITKRGSKYLRKILIQGARAAMPSLARGATPLGSWLRGLLPRVHPNAAVVALANKLARIAWVVLRHGRDFSAPAPAMMP